MGKPTKGRKNFGEIELKQDSLTEGGWRATSEGPGKIKKKEIG